ncbi:MAG: preprotein translocase subunit SecG [Oscillospiraceae bacterium]|nr:preprotein translocase subunit SecG [Oscillospiraceae bacterium]
MDELQGAESEEDPKHVHAAEEESAGHKALRIVLTVLEVIASVALVGIVLVQSGKEAGLSGALSGNSDSYMSKGMRATLDKKLATMTKWVALVWILLTLTLSLI